MTNRLEDEVRHIVASMHEQQNSQEQEPPEPTDQEQQPEETIHIHYFPDAIVILKEDTESQQEAATIETTLAKPKQPPQFTVYAVCVFYLFLILSTLAFQVYLLLNPPVATVTIIPKSQTVTLNSTLQLGRLLNPITISQSLTVPTTGKGHQPAEQATGHITFYNGQLQSITIPAGTIFTVTNGAQIITEQDALIPAASPPIEGQITVSAHAATTGTLGNIPTKAINEACCAISVLAVNLNSFSGGQDERNFQTVTKRDIENTAQPLKTSLSHSTVGALQGQVKPNEQLYQLPCTPHVTADHSIGEEATHVQVTVSQTCSAVAYNSKELTQNATRLIATAASQRLEAGYSVIGAVHTTIRSITVRTSVVVFSVTVQGIWVYQITLKQAHALKSLIAGKTTKDAARLLRSLSGIESASIAWSDDTKLPKDPAYIHFHIMVQA